MKFLHLIVPTTLVLSVSSIILENNECGRGTDVCETGTECLTVDGGLIGGTGMKCVKTVAIVTPPTTTYPDIIKCNQYGVVVKTVKYTESKVEYEKVIKHADKDGKFYQKADNTYVTAPVPINVYSQYGKTLNKVLDYFKDVAEYDKASKKADVFTDTCYQKAADYDSKPDDIVLCNKYGKKSGTVLKYDSEEHKKARDYCQTDGRVYQDEKTKVYLDKAAPITIVDEYGVKVKDCNEGDADYEKAAENEYDGKVYKNKEGGSSGYGKPIAVCDSTGKETGEYIKPESAEYTKAIVAADGDKVYKSDKGYEAPAQLTSGASQMFGQISAIIAALAIVMF